MGRKKKDDVAAPAGGGAQIPAAGSVLGSAVLAALVRQFALGLGKAPEELCDEDLRHASLVAAVAQGLARNFNWRLYVRSRDKKRKDPILYMTDGKDVDETTRVRNSRYDDALAVMAARRAEVEQALVGVVMPARVTLKEIEAHYLVAKRPMAGDPRERFATFESKKRQLAQAVRGYPGKRLVDITKENSDLFVERVTSQPGPRYARTPPGVEPGEPLRKNRSPQTARALLKVLDEAVNLYRRDKQLQYKPHIDMPENHAPRIGWFLEGNIVAVLRAARGCVHDERTGTWVTTRVWDSGRREADGSYVGARDWRFDPVKRTWGVVQLDRPSWVTRFKVDHAAKARWRGVARMIVIGYKTGTRHMAIARMRWDPDGTHGYFKIPPLPEKIEGPYLRGAFRRYDLGTKVTNKNRLGRSLTPTPWKLQALARCWRNADEREGRQWVVTQASGLPYANHVADFAKIFARAGLSMMKLAALGPGLPEADGGDGSYIDTVFHLTRHTCIQRLYELGTSIWSAAAFVGTSVANLQKSYTGWTILGMVEAVDAIDRRPPPAGGRFLAAAE